MADNDRTVNPDGADTEETEIGGASSTLPGEEETWTEEDDDEEGRPRADNDLEDETDDEDEDDQADGHIDDDDRPLDRSIILPGR